MRWEGQAVAADDESALPGLERISGLLRTVTAHEFPGVRFHEVAARSALNAVPAASRVPFRWTINPYRGCTHACVYCFARGTHAWLELDTGTGFDREIVVKVNVVEVLRAELARASWTREHVALGTNTDPYQRAEGRYKLMPGVIAALGASGTPFSVLTKGTLLRRDLPAIASAARDVPVGLAVSVGVQDERLQPLLEPGTPGPRARLDLVRAIRSAGLPCGVLMAPVLPWLTDGETQLEQSVARIAAAGATGLSVIPLHLRPGAREWFMAWLARERPELVGRYRRLYRRGAYVPAEYRDWLNARVRPLLEQHGLGGSSGRDAPPDGADPAEPRVKRRVEPRAAGGVGDREVGVPGDPDSGYPEGSLPRRFRPRRAVPAEVEEAGVAEQPRLL
ncbi:MAG TPA: Rv2578c family radical SAM protein [Kineosporiaceae bacterium]|nr:Rv2578c family radical SAM protein [Kineosporiaceae bacterium]